MCNGLFINNNILADKNLNFGEKIMYAIITGLSIEQGYCYATNKYIANCLSISTGRVGKFIGTLEDKNYIQITTDADARKIKPLKNYLQK